MVFLDRLCKRMGASLEARPYGTMVVRSVVRKDEFGVIGGFCKEGLMVVVKSRLRWEVKSYCRRRGCVSLVWRLVAWAKVEV